MKKIKILFGIIFTALILNVFNFIKLTVFTITSEHTLPSNSEYANLFEIPSWWIGNLIFIVLTISLALIGFGLLQIIKNGIFTEKAIAYLKAGSYTLLFTGVLSLFNDLYSNIPLSNITQMFSFSLDVVMIIASISILVLVDISKKTGISLRLENDLTI